MLHSWWLNIFGLLLGTGGAFVMYFQPPVRMPESFLDPRWIASQTVSGQNALESSRRIARVGVLLLSLGFLLQLAAALVDRFVEHAV